MSIHGLVDRASSKENFLSIQQYIDFSCRYLDFIFSGQNIQADIVARNENNYHFLQYKNDGHFNVTRPLNYDLFLRGDDAFILSRTFLGILRQARTIEPSDNESRGIVNRAIYTIQQTIGAALDALPAGESNRARKVNGDLFERLILLVLREAGVNCSSGVMKVPIQIDGDVAFHMSYQHDLIVTSGDDIKIIGSMKTSSKDRLDKIFIDKYLHNKLTEKNTPHVAIFLNDVQRKG